MFLHGYAGNFSLPCWQIAQAVKGSALLTACPSDDLRRRLGLCGWRRDGARRGEVQLRERGITKMVLAGLSNGGYASMLAPKLGSTFAGYVFISGVEDDAGVAGARCCSSTARTTRWRVTATAVATEQAREREARHAERRPLRDARQAPRVRQALRDFVVHTTGARETLVSDSRIRADRSL